MKIGLLSIVFGLMAASTAAQTPTPIVPANIPAGLAFAHTGERTEGYRIRIDGVKLGSDLPPDKLINGTVTVSLPSLTVGIHRIEACAFNVGGEGCGLLVVDAQTLQPPPAPTSLTFLISGSITLTLQPGK